MGKIVTIKSYDNLGNFIKIIPDATFDNFRKTINGGLSDLTIRLARKIDNFNINLDVSLGNKIEVWIYDEDTGVNGLLIYTGLIEQQNMFARGGEEYVEIVCYGTVSKLNNDVLKSGSQTTLYTIATTGLTITSASLAAAEVSDVLRAIIDKFNIDNSQNYIYSDETATDTIINSGNEMKYTFIAVTYFDAIELCRSIAPQNWYWFIGANNYIYFKAIAGTADHTFILSKDISNIRASKVTDGIKNILLLFNGDDSSPIYKQYIDNVSVSLYGRRVQQMTNNNIKDEATMDNIGATFINTNKDPKIRLEIDIIDNNESEKGYDIESINPGDTCKITGITPDGNIFNDNMVIKEIVWTVGKATLTVETEKEFDFSRFILDIEKKVKELDINKAADLPALYT